MKLTTSASREEADDEEESITTEDIEMGKGGAGKLWIVKTEETNTLGLLPLF